ncbi:methyl-accepting chemotaxis protein [Amphritea atlantica]|uniref:Methyl-accepting chemotaxis protein n=1 Tax=Amphritea atlantica TaxID=355243 RepID=A0ABY5GT40_9GAMM|nr:methyl-accepting chemotaxis protein [Amphritea atlantica]
MNDAAPTSCTERPIAADQKLISVTDKDGVITYCNDDFAALSGYSQEELIGQPHRILTHPDMPQAIANSMFGHLTHGYSWMGIVKNLCKNGEYYWADAYVTPIIDGGHLMGFESVRIRATPDQVKRAQKLYHHLQRNSLVWRGGERVINSFRLALLPAAVATTALAFQIQTSPVLFTAALGLLPFAQALIYRRQQLQLLERIRRAAAGVFDDEFSARIYCGQRGFEGRLKMVLISERARLRTALSRLQDYATRTARLSGEGGNLSKQANHAVQEQRQESELVAVAMQQMAESIGEVSSHILRTADDARQVNLLAQKGQQEAKESRYRIEALSSTMQEIGNSVSDVARQSETIHQAANMINEIAEQTNLLALNAAIEAARAGDQGRGFAVVSDEVRALAARTRDSTDAIQRILGNLQQIAEASVQIVRQGNIQVDDSVQQVINAQLALDAIGEKIVHIDQMSEQMAAASEEQAHVAGEVSTQISRIAQRADDSALMTERSSAVGRDLNNTADALHKLVERFNR